jgi:hypothetical protein
MKLLKYGTSKFKKNCPIKTLNNIWHAGQIPEEQKQVVIINTMTPKIPTHSTC